MSHNAAPLLGSQQKSPLPLPVPIWGGEGGERERERELLSPRQEPHFSNQLKKFHGSQEYAIANEFVQGMNQQ